MRRLSILVAATAVALGCVGCSFGPAAHVGAVRLRVTEDFGARTLGTLSPGRIAHGETDLSLLRRRFPDVTTVGVPYGKSAVGVTSIDGRRGRWSLFVNGVKPSKSAAAYPVHRGDQVWFDLHSPAVDSSVAAVVGSFPEPFTAGIDGQRYPTTIQWSSGLKTAGETIIARMRRFGVVASPAAPGYGSGPDTLSINVGTWGQLYGEVAAELVKYGPGTSGVYAHFASGGHSLDLENAAGTVVKRLGPDSGLIAATANSQDPAPTWLVVGTDRAGVLAAVRALTPQALDGHFALAVHGSTRYPVPLPSSS